MTRAAMHGRVVSTRFESRALRGNLLGDPHVRDVWVYLPPGYDDDAKRRYPTITILPAFGSTHLSLLRWDPWEPNTVERFDRLVASGASRPAILVLPDCFNRWAGSQYLDSPATGAYQTYLADEVIPHVDATFRTIPRGDARAVAGRSSGGFGALRLAIDRPGLVAAIASHAGDAAFDVTMRPMLVSAAIAYVQDGGVEAFARRIVETGPRSGADHDGLFVLAASAAYAPEPDAPEPHAALPFDPRTAVVRDDVWQRWLAHDPLLLVPRAAGGLRSLSLVFLDGGSRDEHGLQFAARLLEDALRGAGAKVHHEEFEGGHRGTSHRFDASLPLLAAALADG